MNRPNKGIDTSLQSRLFQPESLIDILRWRAEFEPDKIAFTYHLYDKDNNRANLSFAGLEQEARKIASLLNHKEAMTASAILLYPPGLDYISGFLACLYAGIVAVPAFPPSITNIERTFSRLETIAHDSNADLILTTKEIRSSITRMLAAEKYSGLKNSKILRGVDEIRATDNSSQEKTGTPPPKWITTDGEHDDIPLLNMPDHRISGDKIAFLQYTSGSTDVPRGVMVTHSNILCNSQQIQNAFEINNETDEAVIWLPFYHDMGLIGGVLQPIFSGVHCNLMSPLSFLSWPNRWLQLISTIKEKRIISGGPNFAYELCVNKLQSEQLKGLDLSNWDIAFTGSEPVNYEVLEKFSDKFSHYGFRKESFYPCYGMAEATLFVSGGKRSHAYIAIPANSTHQAKTRDKSIPLENKKMLVSCGKTSIGEEIIIVNPKTLEELTPGQEGEIWVSGKHVASGYWMKEKESKITFEGFTTQGKGPFLRTGDLGFQENEELYVTGRLKDLIIIHGVNYYPQDIENEVQNCHKALRAGSGAAFSIEINNQEKLAIVQEAEPSEKNGLDTIIQIIRRTIGEIFETQVYAVILIKSKTIPKTSSGKIQRRLTKSYFMNGKLQILKQDILEFQDQSNPDIENKIIETDTVELRNSYELFFRWFMAVLSSHINIKNPEEKQDYALAELGIDSILVVQLKNYCEDKLYIPITFEELFEAESIKQLSKDIFKKLSHASADKHLPGIFTDSSGLLEGRLSYNQKAMWLMQQYAPESAAFNVYFSAKITSNINFEYLKKSLSLLADQHPILRSTFHIKQGVPIQTIGILDKDFFRVVDTCSWNSRMLDEAINHEAHRPFNLETGPLIRATLFSGADTGNILLINFHHICVDLWSVTLLMTELIRIYSDVARGRSILFEGKEHTYFDFIQWQERFLNSPAAEVQLNYWASRLSGEYPALSLSEEKPRPVTKTFNGGSVEFEIDSNQLDELKTIARQENVTLYVLLLSVFNILLHNYSHEKDILIGSPVSGRSNSVFENITGYFVNTIVIRSEVNSNETFKNYLNQIKKAVSEALEHQDYPFALLVEKLQPHRDAGRSPFFDVMFVLERPQTIKDIKLADFLLAGNNNSIEAGDFKLEAYHVKPRTSQFDLTLSIVEGSSRLGATFQYNTDIFTESNIVELTESYITLLQNISRNSNNKIGRLPMLTQESITSILKEGQNLLPFQNPVLIHELIQAKALSYPGKAAISCNNESITYGELIQKSDTIAEKLERAGAKKETRVGLMLDRSINIIAGILGIFKAGCTYVPLDFNYPKERLDFMINDSGIDIILTGSHLLNLIELKDDKPELIAIDLLKTTHESKIHKNDSLSGLNAAYIIYTSGSTGKPKGVMITHDELSEHCVSMREYYSITDNDRIMQFSSLNFDASLEQIFTALISGATLFLRDKEIWLPTEFLGNIIENKLTIANIPPAYWLELINEWTKTPEILADTQLRLLIIGGEKISGDILSKWQHINNKKIRLLNAYGPTETTITSLIFDIPDNYNCTGKNVPIGKPCRGRALYLLNNDFYPVPRTVKSELFIGGKSLARGYNSDPALTAEKFLPDPFSIEPGQRMYRTGDIVKFLPDHNVEFIGRADNQIKIRGFRIELGEIESAIRESGLFANALVVLQEEAQESKKLIAYLVNREIHNENTVIGKLRDYLSESLPRYMIPSEYVLIKSIPLMPNGKIDRKALPELNRQAEKLEMMETEPKNNIEKKIAEILQEILKKEKISRSDNFFDLGGHSLLGIQAVIKIKEKFKISLKVSDLFDNPTVKDLSRIVIDQLVKNSDAKILEEKLNKLEEIPRIN